MLVFVLSQVQGRAKVGGRAHSLCTLTLGVAFSLSLLQLTSQSTCLPAEVKRVT